MKKSYNYRPYSALSEDDKANIREFYLTGIPSFIDLSIIYKVSVHTIEIVCDGLAPIAVKNRNARFNWFGDFREVYALRKELYFYYTKKYRLGYGHRPFDGTIYAGVTSSFDGLV